MFSPNQPVMCSLKFVTLKMCIDKTISPTGTCMKGNVRCPPCNTTTPSLSVSMTSSLSTAVKGLPPPSVRRRNITIREIDDEASILSPRASQVVTGCGPFIPPDVAITSQLVFISQCRGDTTYSSSSTSGLRRPMVSLARFWDQSDDHMELLLLFITTGCVYLLHILVVVVVFMFALTKPETTRYASWVLNVHRFVYPAQSIRYHLSMVLPMA
eukprot:PhF_6_TR40218/c2_g5_i1/m.59750